MFDLGDFLNSFFAWLGSLIQNQPINLLVTSTAFISIIALLYECIQNPTGAINTFMIMVEDMITTNLPSTPPQYTLWGMMDNFAAAYPQIGWGPVYEIMNGIAGMLQLYLGVKILRFLPFFGG